jgi:hypothetical protein
LHLIVPLPDTLKDFLLSCDGPGRGELAAWRMQTLNGLKLARGQTRTGDHPDAIHPQGTSGWNVCASHVTRFKEKERTCTPEAP